MARTSILVIGDSVSSGVTGLEVDQRVIAAHGCYAKTATTALTVKDPLGTDATYYPPADFVKKAIASCFANRGVEVVKIGFLPSLEIVQTVVEALRGYGPRSVVVDPAIASESEGRPLSDQAVEIIGTELLPQTTVLTLSIPEAVLLLEKAGTFDPVDVRDLDDLILLAKALHGLGAQNVLLKGDRLPLAENLEAPKSSIDKQPIVDVLYDGTDINLIKTAYVDMGSPQNARGALASAIASNLALGDAVPSATQKACRYVEAGISKRDGLVNYFHSTYTLPFIPGYFFEYLLSRDDVKPVWHAHVHHDFVKQISDGTLQVGKFKEYLVQDYLFLVQFARAKALSAYKSKSMKDIAADAELILHIQREMSLHLDYCAEFGLSKKDIEGREEHQACTAYTRYVLDIAHSESWFALQMAFAPCLMGYGVIAKRLFDDPQTVGEKDNRYWKWIQNYVADDYRAAVVAGRVILEKHAVLQSPSQIESLVRIFVHATKMEMGFWDMASE